MREARQRAVEAHAEAVEAGRLATEAAARSEEGAGAGAGAGAAGGDADGAGEEGDGAGALSEPPDTFADIDADGDRQLTFTSLHSAALVVMRMRPGTGMAALDKDGDGKISEEEFNAKKLRKWLFPKHG